MSVPPCVLLIRSSFLVIATPLLFLGALFSGIATQLQLQGVRYFEYAIGEETTAVGLQGQADTSAAEAMLAQTEADELGADVARLEGEAATGSEEGSAAAGEDAGETAVSEEGTLDVAEAGDTVDTSVSTVEGVASSVGTGAEAGANVAGGAGASVETAAQVAALVEDAAATTAGAVAAAGDSVAAGAAAAGATGAEASAAEAAAEATVAAAAVPEEVEAGAVVGTAAAIGAAGTAIAVEGPKAVAATEGEWAAASAEIQIARDESVLAEKEAEAGALEASVPVYQEGSVLTQAAAATSLASGASCLAFAQMLQIIALMCQAPIAFVFVSRWIWSGGSHIAAQFRVPADAVHRTPSAKYASYLQHTLTVSKLALVSAVCLFLIPSWVDTIIVATEWENSDVIISKLASLPQLVRQNYEHVQDKQHLADERHRRMGRDWSVNHMASSVGHSVEETFSTVAEGVNETAHAVAKTARSATDATLRTANSIYNKTPSAKFVAEQAKEAAQSSTDATLRTATSMYNNTPSANVVAEQAKEAAGDFAQGAGEVVHATEASAMDLAKKTLVAQPNTATTTVAPIHVKASPASVQWSHFLSLALERLWKCLWFFSQSMVTDALICATAVAAFTFVHGVGAQLPRWSCGCSGHATPLLGLFYVVLSSAVSGLAILGAAWVFTIVLAVELTPLANWLRHSQLTVAAYTISFVCVMSACCHAFLLSKLPCLCNCKQSLPEMEKRETSEQHSSRDCTYGRLPTRPDDRAQTPDTSNQMTECMFWFSASVVTISAALLSSLEGPASSWAISSASKSLVANWWLIPIVPWGQVVAQTWGGVAPVFRWVLEIVVGGALLLACTYFIRRRKSTSTTRDELAVLAV